MVYINLKSAIYEAEKANGVHDLDHISRDMLHQITVAQIRKQPLCISDLAQNSQHGTAPTVYARLKKLVEAGWIERSENKNDKRSVILTITPKTQTTIKKISRVLERSI